MDLIDFCAAKAKHNLLQWEEQMQPVALGLQESRRMVHPLPDLGRINRIGTKMDFGGKVNLYFVENQRQILDEWG